MDRLKTHKTVIWNADHKHTNTVADLGEGPRGQAPAPAPPPPSFFGEIFAKEYFYKKTTGPLFLEFYSF